MPEDPCSKTCCQIQTEALDLAAIIECEGAGLEATQSIIAASLLKLLCGSFIVYDAWTPVLALEQVGNDLAFKVTNWINGSGVKPDVNVYIGESGFVDTFPEAKLINLSATVTGGGAFIGSYTAGADLTSSRFVNISGNDTVIYADSSLGLEANGFISSAALTGAPVDVFNGGLFGGFASLVGGNKRYLSTSGTSSLNAPSSSGHISQQVAVAKNASEIYIDIEEPTTIP